MSNYYCQRFVLSHLQLPTSPQNEINFYNPYGKGINVIFVWENTADLVSSNPRKIVSTVTSAAVVNFSIRPRNFWSKQIVTYCDYLGQVSHNWRLPGRLLINETEEYLSQENTTHLTIIEKKNHRSQLRMSYIYMCVCVCVTERETERNLLTTCFGRNSPRSGNTEYKKY
jgi:hypothetical protein